MNDCKKFSFRSFKMIRKLICLQFLAKKKHGLIHAAILILTLRMTSVASMEVIINISFSVIFIIFLNFWPIDILTSICCGATFTQGCSWENFLEYIG